MKKITLFFVMAIALTSTAYAQPGAIDPTFSSFTNCNGTINSTLTLPDGKIIVVGTFTNVNGTSCSRIVRLNSNGALDLSFAINLTNGPTIGRAIKLQSNGKIIVAGQFTSINGIPGPGRIIRLNADGTLDTTFNSGGIGADATIQSITIDGNDKILIGGSFVSYNGVIRNRIARLNPDGTLDLSFVVASGANSTINAIEIQPSDSKIIIAGNFTAYNGISRSRIARLNTDGSLDTGFVSAIANLAARTIAIQPDGKIIYGGDFTTYGGDVNKRFMVRVNPNGSLDTSYNCYGFNGSVRAISLDPNGKLLVAGAFANYNVSATANIARLTADASLDYTFNTTGTNGAVESAIIQADGKILVGGSFTTFNGVSSISLVRISGYFGTQLRTTYCGSELSALSTTISADLFHQAQGYRFKITKVDTVTNLPLDVPIVVDRTVNNISLISLGAAYNSKYKVEVGVKLNDLWEPYFGAPCFVSVFNPIATIGAKCNTTVTSMGEFIYATYVPSVKAYRFRITNTATNEVEVYDALSGLNRFSFSQLQPSIRTFGGNYFVEVALKNTDGSFLPYTAGCSITTPAFPTSQITVAQCNAVATSNTQNFSSDIISGATNYRFQLSNAGLGYLESVERTINTYNLSLFTGLQSGTTYTVRVAVRIGGVWGPLTGQPCNVTTPGTAPVASRTILADANFKAIAYPNPFAENFMFDVTTADQGPIQVRVYDMLGKQVENRNVEFSDSNSLQIGGSYPSGVYNVIVSQGENIQTLRVIKR